MQQSYLEYAMSVIVGRALPDVRDGLKPVHRRILYAMHELGLTQIDRFVNVPGLWGDVLGKYHPHGDQAVYDALVRLVQEFPVAFRYCGAMATLVPSTMTPCSDALHETSRTLEPGSSLERDR